MTPDKWLFLFILFTAMLISVRKNKLTVGGAITGGVIGFFIFLGARYTGIIMIGLFFLCGTMATAWKINLKENEGFAELNKGRRTAGQVFANGGVAGIAGLLSFYIPEQGQLFQLMM